MKIEFSPEEQQAALEVAEQFEKKKRTWSRDRWLSIVLLVLALGLMFAAERLTGKMHGLFDLNEDLVRESRPQTVEHNAHRIDMLETTIDTRILAVRIEMFMLLKALFF